MSSDSESVPCGRGRCERDAGAGVPGRGYVGEGSPRENGPGGHRAAGAPGKVRATVQAADQREPILSWSGGDEGCVPYGDRDFQVTPVHAGLYGRPPGNGALNDP